MNPILIVAGIVLAITLLIIFLSHHLDSDFTLHVYENILGRKASEVLRGKVAWITGASGGIGEQVAYQLVKFGCKLVLSARKRDELERVKDKCAGQSMRMMVEKTPFHVDQEIININFFGAISLTKAVLPYMIERKQGQITVVSSAWGKYGHPGVAPYSASNFALLGYFRSLRREVSNRNIKIVTVLPGPIATNIRIHSLRDTSDPDAPKVDLKQSKPMSAERCSYLMTVAMVNNVKEAWICNSPNLKQFYLAQYMPSLYEWLYEG